MIVWRSQTQFEIDNVRFNIDMRSGPDRAPSSEDAFTFVKTKRMINIYRSLARLQPKRVLEFGVFQGGSVVFFEKLFQPERLVGIELSTKAIPALEAHLARGSAIRPYFGVSQSDRPGVEKIIASEFPEGLDLIVDDASHLYDHSKASFEISFPFLKPGGVYVIEDWAWSHKTPFNAENHPWRSKPALTNLVFELVVSVAGPSSIAKLEVFPELVIITKSAAPREQDEPALNLAPNRLRGRRLEQI